MIKGTLILFLRGVFLKSEIPETEYQSIKS